MTRAPKLLLLLLSVPILGCGQTLAPSLETYAKTCASMVAPQFFMNGQQLEHDVRDVTLPVGAPLELAVSYLGEPQCGIQSVEYFWLAPQRVNDHCLKLANLPVGSYTFTWVEPPACDDEPPRRTEIRVRVGLGP